MKALHGRVSLFGNGNAVAAGRRGREGMGATAQATEAPHLRKTHPSSSEGESCQPPLNLQGKAVCSCGRQ